METEYNTRRLLIQGATQEARNKMALPTNKSLIQYPSQSLWVRA